MIPINEAITLACTLHDGQYDKDGQPYIYHVLRVIVGLPILVQLKTAATREYVHIIAALHDVLEDVPKNEAERWALEEIIERAFGKTVLSSLLALTRTEGEDYDEYITRVCRDPYAALVKQADIADSMQRWRYIVGESRQARSERLDRYRKTLVRVSEAILKHDREGRLT